MIQSAMMANWIIQKVASCNYRLKTENQIISDSLLLTWSTVPAISWGSFWLHTCQMEQYFTCVTKDPSFIHIIIDLALALCFTHSSWLIISNLFKYVSVYLSTWLILLLLNSYIFKLMAPFVMLSPQVSWFRSINDHAWL